jgi:thymidylate synthase (FAD)
MQILSYERDLQVTLVQASPYPEKAVKLACMVATKAELPTAWEDTPQPAPKLIEQLYKNKHHSPFEQVSFTFLCENISRALLAQITRQRTAKFMSGSQHYQDYSDYAFVIHQAYANGASQEYAIYNKAFDEALKAYRSLLDLGVPRSEARMVLPQASTVNLLMTIDARNLMYFLEMRLSKNNVKEMRVFAQALHHLAIEEFPHLFDLIKPGEQSAWEKEMHKGAEL